MSDVEKEFCDILAKEIGNEIDCLLTDAALGFRTAIHKMTFIDSRYEYGQQRVWLEVKEVTDSAGNTSRTLWCNRPERSFSDYVTNFETWTNAGYLTEISGDMTYFISDQTDDGEENQI